MVEPTVFIVDDDEGYRDSVQELVSSVGLPTETFASALDFLEVFDPERQGCLVLDVRLARMSGLALQERLRESGATLPIVFISGHGDIAMAVKALKDGEVDFVQKPYREQLLLDAINEALRRCEPGEETKTPATPQAVASRMAALSPRELEVMALALDGLSSKVIAKQLEISHRTVEQHRSTLLEKLGVSSIAELLRLKLRGSLQ